MNKIKKIVSTMLIALSLVGAVAPLAVSAAPVEETGSLTVHKYQIDETFEPNSEYEQNGTQIGSEVIGTRENEDGEREEVKISDLLPLEGVEFLIEKVRPKMVNGQPVRPVEYEVDESFKAEKIVINNFGFATLADLEFGVYKVTELPSAAIETEAEPFYVSIPHYNETLDRWIYDVHVYVKNQVKQPEIHKSVTELENQHDTTNVFDEVKWIVTSEIPDDIATSKKYVVTDKLDGVLQYVSNSLKVSFDDIGAGGEVVLIAGVDYEFDLNKNGRESYEWQDEMTISLTAAGRTKVAQAVVNKPANEKAWLKIEFNTKIELSETDLETILGEKIPNQAELTYTNSLNVTFTPESEIPEVHLGGVLLKKVDARGTVLQGAKFKIYESLEDAKGGVNAIKNPSGSAGDWVVTSGTDGLVKFFGLAYGEIGQAYNDENAQTTYWIVEVEAPKDENGKSYNLLKEPLEVVVNRTSHNKENVIVVVNTKFDLPLTGGEGNTMFIMSGIVLVVVGLGAIIAVKKKRQFKDASGK